MPKPIDPKSFPQRLEQVRKYIQKKYPDLDLGRDHGRYFWTSKNDDLELKLCGHVYSKSVGVYHCSHLTYEMWMSHADDIMNEINYPDCFIQGRQFKPIPKEA